MQDRPERTFVQNILDDRSHVFHLPAPEAVVAAHEFFDRENYDTPYRDPQNHPQFKVHKRGFSCGDWIAYNQTDEVRPKNVE